MKIWFLHTRLNIYQRMTSEGRESGGRGGGVGVGGEGDGFNQ